MYEYSGILCTVASLLESPAHYECSASGPGHAPYEKPFRPALNQEGACQHDPVHEPWSKLGGIGGLEGLVGGEEGEEEGGDGRQELREYVEHGH